MLFLSAIYFSTFFYYQMVRGFLFCIYSAIGQFYSASFLQIFAFEHKDLEKEKK